MAFGEKDSHRNGNDLEEVVDLYEEGYKEIQSIIVDSDLTSDEQLDAIADIVFDDPIEG